ncbi:transposase [Trichonephila clavipes]|nr:transposase [Trichonephila clavipes]
MGNFLEVTVFRGKFQGEVVLLPRIPMIPSDSPIPFKRLQFPIRLAFSMTINKSQDNLVALHFKYDQARRRFVEWAQNEIAVVPNFHKRILFSDEAHLWLNGYVNKQNCRIWSEANPQVYVETALNPEKLTVWCALWAGGILLEKR